MRRRRSLWRHILLTSWIVSFCGGLAQAPATGPITLRTGTSEVNLSFHAADERGRSIEDLALSDLEVRDDGRKPVRILSFQHRANVPMRTGVLVDTSSSMLGLRRHQEIARKYVRSVLRSSTDQAFVMRFDFDTAIRQDWTSDAVQLESGVAEVAQDAASRLGGTALFDSLYIACRDKFKAPQAGGEIVSNVILLFSDGRDNRSHTRIPEVLRECQTTDTAVYVFSDETRPTRDSGQRVLKELAERSGGRVFFDRDGEDLQDLFLISQDARDTYVVVYKPALLKPNGSFHKVKLDCPKRTAFLTSRPGYYAPEK